MHDQAETWEREKSIILFPLYGLYTGVVIPAGDPVTLQCYDAGSPAGMTIAI